MVPKMSQSATQIEPLVPRDTYPVMRVAVEYFLRAVDILPEVHHDLVTSVVFVTLWYGQVQGRGRSPVSIRELSRKMGLPYETVRRHARALVRGGQCIEQKGGLAVAPAMMRSRQTAAMLRRSYVNAVRMLRHLTSIEVARFNVGPDRRLRSGRLTAEQTAIGVAGIGLLLTGLRTLHAFVGDLVKGLVYTAIWTANVKHVTNTPAAGSRGILKDSQRLPVSVLAISNALRLPYETVRRHADALQKEGYCTRVGRKGLIAPAVHHHQQRNVETMVDGYHVVMAFLAELRRVGIKA